jgi:hypothetical protein
MGCRFELPARSLKLKQSPVALNVILGILIIQSWKGEVPYKGRLQHVDRKELFGLT